MPLVKTDIDIKEGKMILLTAVRGEDNRSRVPYPVKGQSLSNPIFVKMSKTCGGIRT